MREKLLWFFVGAACASAVAVFIAWRPDSANDAALVADTRNRAELAQRLDKIERRLVAASEPHDAPANTPATAGRDARPVVESSPVDAVSAPPTPAQQRAAEESGDILEHAIRAGIWSNKDADDFVRATAGMHDAQRFELKRQLVMAINEDRLQVEAGAELR